MDHEPSEIPKIGCNCVDCSEYRAEMELEHAFSVYFDYAGIE